MSSHLKSSRRTHPLKHYKHRQTLRYIRLRTLTAHLSYYLHLNKCSVVNLSAIVWKTLKLQRCHNSDLPTLQIPTSETSINIFLKEITWGENKIIWFNYLRRSNLSMPTPCVLKKRGTSRDLVDKPTDDYQCLLWRSGKWTIDCATRLCSLRLSNFYIEILSRST